MAPASAQRASDYGYEYFNTVGRVIGEAKAIPWMGELCAEAFPSTKAPIEVALRDWTDRNKEAQSTLDAQFDVIDKYWATLPATDQRGRQTKQEMINQIKAQRPALKQQLESGDPSKFSKLCSGYAQALQSTRMDIEVRWGPQMSVIRGGPK
jgi:hypothetical protein